MKQIYIYIYSNLTKTLLNKCDGSKITENSRSHDGQLKMFWYKL